MKAVNNLPDHALDSHVSKEGSLVNTTVTDRVELESLRFFITCVELEPNGISS